MVKYCIFLIVFFSSIQVASLYSAPTCESSETVDCGHTNVAHISGFTAADVAFLRCSGTLIAKDEFKAVFLTANHCIEGWAEDPTVVTIGVSMDPVIEQNVSP